jgi:hypothetical protein
VIVVVFMMVLPLAVANGQDFSIDPASPEVPFLFSPADIVAQGGGVTLVPSGWLGLTPADNIDGFSYGADFVRPVTPGNPLAVRFSVSRTTVGMPATIVNAEATGNGAAGDIFWGFIIPNGGAAQGPWRLDDAPNIGLTPLPAESDVDGVEGLNGGAVLPIAYFSLDAATAAAYGVSAADVLYQVAVGTGAPPPMVFAAEAVMGLLPGDDIDAVAVFDLVAPGTFGVGDFIFVSLTPGSPTLLALGASPASIIEISVFAPPFVTMTPAQSGLLLTDDVNAVTCYDIACLNLAGDANHDGTLSISDPVYIINYVFAGGNPPICPNEGDANGDGQINISDVVFIINFIFAGGPAPVPGTVY